MKHRPTAAEAALLLVYMARAYDEEKSKDTSRFRVTSDTLRRVCGRNALRGPFVEELENEIAELKWSVVWVGNNLGIIRSKTIDGWPRIASKRIRDVLKRVEKGDRALFDEIETKLGVANGGEEGGEETEEM